MRDYGFSLTHILLYKDRIVDSVLIGRMRVSENSYSRIFYAVLRKHFGESCTFQISYHILPSPGNRESEGNTEEYFSNSSNLL